MKKTLLLLFILTSLGAYAQKTQLRLNLKKDSTYYLTFNISMDIDQLIQGQHQGGKIIMTGSTSHKIVSIQDTIYNMEVAYKRISMLMNFGDRKIELNSEGDTANILTKLMRSILNKPFNMTMSNRGAIIEVKNFDKLFTGELNMPGMTEEKKRQLMGQLRQSFGENSLKSSLQQTFIIYPKKLIGLKGIWADQTLMDAVGISAKMQNTYTFDNITNDSYEISGKSVVLPDGTPPFKQSSQIYLRFINVNGTTQATYKIDKTTGWVTESKTTKHVAGTAEIKQSPTGPIVATYPATIDVAIESTGK